MEASGAESSVTQSISTTLPSNTAPADRGFDKMDFQDVSKINLFCLQFKSIVLDTFKKINQKFSLIGCKLKPECYTNGSQW